jgi:hypothetical protein
MRFHVRHGGDPLLQQQILKPCGGKTFQTVPHHVVVLRLRNATAFAKSTYNLVEYSGLRWQHLIYAAYKEWAVLLRQHGGVFSRQSETLCRSVVIQITGRSHAAQPLAKIALVHVCSRSELRRCRRPLLRQILE